MPRTSNVFAFTSNSFNTPVDGEVIDPTDATTTWADIVVGLNSSPANASYIGKTIQPWASLTCVNGANTDLALPVGTNFYITGPTGIFTISGLAASGGNEDGRIIRLYNSVAFALTITNDATSTAANRFLTLTGADVTTTTQGLITLVYSSTASRWINCGSQV
jgi:hypothetical protein